jgi:hypothetical protein
MEEIVEEFEQEGQKPTPTKEVWQRAARTIIQLIAAGGLTALTDQIASDLPANYAVYFMILYTAVVSWSQNYLESKEVIPTILKK